MSDGIPVALARTRSLAELTIGDALPEERIEVSPTFVARQRHGSGGVAGGRAVSTISGSAAIVGIGATEFFKGSGRSEPQLAAEAVRAALADAGLEPSDVDGLVTFNMDNNTETAVVRELGIPS